MHKLVKVVSSLLVLLLMFSFVACNGSKSIEGTVITSTKITVTPPVELSAAKQFTIGWSVYNSAFEYFATMQDGVLDKAKELGINVITHDQKSDKYEMIIGCIKLINKGVDVLIVSPYYPDGMVLITQLAKEAGIPVIVVDVGTGGADVDAFIISDNFGGGVLAGEYALELTKEHSLASKNAAIIKVEPTSTYAIRRGDAFKSVMLESDYKIVAEVTANSDTDQAYLAMKNILASYSDDLSVVFCENDRMALGAAQAIDEAGKKGQIMLIGFDGIPSAIEAIKDGSMQGTIAQQPFNMGELGVELASDLLTGKPIIYDDNTTKELYVEVYLIDETGEPRIYNP